LLRETTPPPEQIAFRLQAVERDIVLPVKAVFVGILLYHLFFSRWFEDVALPRSVAQQTIEQFFLIYLGLNVAVAMLLIFSSRKLSPFMQGVIFTNSFVDGLFLAALTFVTGGFDSILYWMFLGLIVRNAISVPLAFPQIFLNLSVSFCYLLAGVLDVVIQDEILEFGAGVNQRALANPTEPFLLRLIVLWLMTICCYGVQILLERHRQAQEEAQEFASRQMQLHSAGRLAAQIAHQLKNPLGIINNAAFTLQRALGSGKPPSPEQVQIIREEVERSDRILTKLMGYAQLAESHVERLNVAEEMDRAVEEVFPAGGAFRVEVARDYEAHLPPLLMQRGHFSEIMVNLLLNAREAMAEGGRVGIRAYARPDHTVILEVSDQGPGIDPKHVSRIFNSYYSTKEKGTGLGLAIVKNNLEMYSGKVEVHSELGKGTTFHLEFPTRTLMREVK
jgi:signal transduction histidine kinase